MACEPYKALSLYLHLLWNPYFLHAYHIVNIWQTISALHYHRETCRAKEVYSESMWLCANAAYSCFVSPNVAKIHVSLWQPPLSKAWKTMSWSQSSCIRHLDAPAYLPLLCFLPPIVSFAFPTVTSSISFSITEDARRIWASLLSRLQLWMLPSLVMVHRVNHNEWQHCFARF